MEEKKKESELGPAEKGEEHFEKVFEKGLFQWYKQGYRQWKSVSQLQCHLPALWLPIRAVAQVHM